MKKALHFSIVVLTMMMMSYLHVLAAAPTVQAYNISFTYPDQYQHSLLWTSGNGSNRIVVAYEGETTVFPPATALNGYDFMSTATPVFSSAPTINGYGTYRVVYAGNSNTITLTLPHLGTWYSYKVYEYNGSGGTTEYLDITSDINPAIASTGPEAPGSPSVNPAYVYSTSFRSSWAYPSGTFDGYELEIASTDFNTQLLPGYNPASINDASALSYDAANLNPNTQYTWRIRSTLGARVSDWATYSGTVTTTPATPTFTTTPSSTICYGQSTTITATAPLPIGTGTGEFSFRFYENSYGGTPLSYASETATVTYETPILTTTTVYYVSTYNNTNSIETNPREPVTVTVIAAPDFTGNQPESQSICTGNSNINFISNPANATELNWQVSNDGGSSWTDVSSLASSSYTGATTSQLVLCPSPTTINETWDGSIFRLLARNETCVTWWESSQATLTVPTESTFWTIIPADGTVCAGISMTFTGLANNDADTYKWRGSWDGESWWDLSEGTTGENYFIGTTTSTLILNNTTAAIENFKVTVWSKAAGCPSTHWFEHTNYAEVIDVYDLGFSPTDAMQSATVCVGEDHVFNSGNTEATEFRWEVFPISGTTTWIDISDYDYYYSKGFFHGETTSALTITGITSPMNGMYFRYRARNLNACTDSWITYSGEPVTLTVINQDSPTFTQYSNLDATVCQNEMMTLSATFTPATMYKWQSSLDNSSFIDLTDSVNGYTGVTTSILTINNADPLLHQRWYRALARNNYCPTTWFVPPTSSTVTVTPVVNFLHNPASASVCSSGTWSIWADAEDAVNYIWQVYDGTSWLDITEAGGSSSFTSPVTMSFGSNTITILRIESDYLTANPTSTMTLSDEYNTLNQTYRLMGHNTIGGSVYCPTSWAYTSPAVITTSGSPDFTVNQPESKTICVGTNNVIFRSSPVFGAVYDWQISYDEGSSWTDISEITNASNTFTGYTTSALRIITIPDETPGVGSSYNGLQFRLLSRNEICPTTWIYSNPVTLTVPTETTMWSTLPISNTVCIGSSQAFTAVANNDADQYKWRGSWNGTTWEDLVEGTTGENYWTGTTTSALSLNNATYAMNGYNLTVWSKAMGCPQTHWNEYTDYVVITVIDPGYSPPGAMSDRTVCTGESTTFTSGNTSATDFRWEVFPVSGTTWVDVTDYFAWTQISGQTTANLVITAATAPMNGMRFRYQGLTGSCNEQWIPYNGEVLLTVENAVLPTVLTNPTTNTVCIGTTLVFTGSFNNANQYQWERSLDGSSWVELAENADYVGVHTTELTVTASLPYSQWFRLKGRHWGCPSSWVPTNAAELQLVTPSAIISGPSPSSQTVCRMYANSATFSASSTFSTVHQWQRLNGSQWEDITGAPYTGYNSCTLTIDHITSDILADEQYRLNVQNPTCSSSWTSSTVCTLHVTAYPEFNSTPTSITVCNDLGSTPNSFYGNATDANIFKWQYLNIASNWTDVSDTGGDWFDRVTGANSQTLTITAPVEDAWNGTEFRLTAMNFDCPATWAESNAATLFVLTSASFTLSNPVNTTICAGCGETAYFEATENTNDEHTLYQWWYSTEGTTWNQMTDGVIGGATYTGATTTRLAITCADFTPNGYQYQLRAKHENCPTTWAHSDVATLYVHNPISITMQPADASVCNVLNHTLFANSAYSSTFVWQVWDSGLSTWQNVTVSSGTFSVSNGTINVVSLTNNYGANASSSITLRNVATTDISLDSKYRVITRYQLPTGEFCPTTWEYSNEAQLTTAFQPEFVSNSPANASVCAGTAGQIFNTTFERADLFNWQYWDTSDWYDCSTQPTDYSGTNTSALTLNFVPVKSDDGRIFRLRASNATCLGSWIDATPVTLSVYVNPTIWTVEPASNASVCVGYNQIYTAKAEQDADIYKWLVSTNHGYDWADIPNGTSQFGTYEGVTTSALTIIGAQMPMNTYRYKVAAQNTVCGGEYWFEFTHHDVLITVHDYASFTMTALPDVTVCVDENTTFTANTDGANQFVWQVMPDPPLPQVWFNVTDDVSFTTHYQGWSTNTLTVLTIPSGMHNRKFRLVGRLSGAACPSSWAPVSSSFTMWVQNVRPNIVFGTHPTTVTVCKFENATISSGILSTVDEIAWERSGDGTTWDNITDATHYSGYTTTNLTIHTVDEEISTYWTRYRIKARYRLCPTTWSYQTGNIEIIPTAPEYLANPMAMSTTVCSPYSTTLVVYMDNDEDINYQWQIKDGTTWANVIESTTPYPTIYTGVTTSELTISNTTDLNGKIYRTILQKWGCPTTWGNEENAVAASTSATLTVSPRPTFTGPASTTFCNNSRTGVNEGGIIPDNSFTAEVTNATAYKWQISLDGGTSWADIASTTYTGYTTTKLTVTAKITPDYDGYQYRILAKNDNCLGTWEESQAAELNVPADLTTWAEQPQDATVCQWSQVILTGVAHDGTSSIYANEYLWQYQNASSAIWNDVNTLSSNYSGYTTSALTIASADVAENNRKFRVLARLDGCPYSWFKPSTGGYAGYAVITVQLNPSFATTTATSSTACETESTTFSIQATNATTYQWQWYENGPGVYMWHDVSDGYFPFEGGINATCAGETSTALEISNIGWNLDNMQFRLVAFNNGCPETGINSNTFTLRVRRAPSFGSITDKTIYSCETLENVKLDFGQGANDATSYAWVKLVAPSEPLIWETLTDASVYSGQNTTQLNIIKVTSEMNGFVYSLMARNADCPTEEWVQSPASITLVILNGPDFTDQQPESQTICQTQTSVTFTSTPSDAVAYRWFYSTNNGTNWSPVPQDPTNYWGETNDTLIVNTLGTTGKDLYQFRMGAYNWDNNAFYCPSHVDMDPDNIANYTLSNIALLDIVKTPILPTANVSNTVCTGTDVTVTSFTPSQFESFDNYTWQYYDVSSWHTIGEGERIGEIGFTGVTSTRLTIDNPNDKDLSLHISSNTLIVRMNATNSSCTTVNSGEYHLEVLPNVDFTVALGAMNPSSQTICETATAHISCQPANADQWQWYVSVKGGAFTPISDVSNYAGFTTTMLTVSNVQDKDGFRYQLRAKNLLCDWVSSTDYSTLHVYNQPVFLGYTQTTATVCSGLQEPEIRIIANVNYYQDINWQFSNNGTTGWTDCSTTTDYAGTNSATLTVTNLTANKWFRVQARNGGGLCGDYLSATELATLQMYPAPTNVVISSANAIVCGGTSQLINGTVTGDYNALQWYSLNASGSFTPISAQTSRSYTFNAPTLPETKQYVFKLYARHYGCPTSWQQSNEVTITVPGIPTYTLTTTSGTFCAGAQTPSTTIVPNFVQATNPVFTWWYTVDGTNYTQILPSNTNFAGQTTSALIINTVTPQMDGWKIKLNVVVNGCPAGGISSTNVYTMRVPQGNMPTITAVSSDRTICANTTGYVWVDGTDLVNIKWYKRGVSNPSTSFTLVSGATSSTLSVTPATGDRGHVFAYYMVANNPAYCNSELQATSSTITVTVPEEPTISETNVIPSNSIVCSGASATLTASITNFDLVRWQIRYNDTPNWIDLTDATQLGYGTYTGSTTTRLVISNVGTSLPNITFRVNAKNNTCPLTGTTAGNYRFTVLDGNQPTYTNINSATVIACAGTPYIFNVDVDNYTEMKWQVNKGTSWEDIAGATSENYTLNPVQNTTYAYRITARNTSACNQDWKTSNEATLLVPSNPTDFTSIANRTTCITPGNSTEFPAGVNNATETRWEGSYNNGAWQVITDGNITGAEINFSNTKTLSIRVNSIEINNWKFRFAARNYGCPADWSATSNTFSLYAYATPLFIEHPANTPLVCSGSDWVFTSHTAANTSTSYTWQISTNGTTWANIVNGGTNPSYTGVNSTRLVISNIPVTLNNNQFRMLAYNNECPENGTPSNAAIMQVVQAPIFSSTPTSATVCRTATGYTFTASVTNMNKLQWQMESPIGSDNWIQANPFTGVTTNTLAISPITYHTLGDFARFRLLAWNNSCPTAVSSGTYTLTIPNNYVFTSGDLSRTVCVGASSTFSPTVELPVGTTQIYPVYQWYSKAHNVSVWTPISGATNLNYELTNAQTSMDGNQYRLVASNYNCPTTSQTYSLRVPTDPTFSGSIYDRTVCALSTTTLLSTAVNANQFRWEFINASGLNGPYDGWYGVTDGYDAIANSTFSGATTSALTLSNVSSNLTAASYKFRLRVWNDGCQPAGALNTTEHIDNAVSITVPNEPRFSEQLADATVCGSSGHTFRLGTQIGYNADEWNWQVSDNGGANWYDVSYLATVKHHPYTGWSTSALVLNPTYVSMHGNLYRLQARKFGCPEGGSLSNAARLYIHFDPVFLPGQEPADAYVCSGLSHTFTSEAIGGYYYRWQYKKSTATSWTNCVNGFIYDLSSSATFSGAYSPNLVISDVTGMNGVSFRQTAQTSAHCPYEYVMSDFAVLTVVTNPTFATLADQPQSVHACQGDNITITGNPTPADEWKWQVSTNGGTAWTDLSNNDQYTHELTKTLVINGVSRDPGSTDYCHDYQYRLAARNVSCPVTWLYSNPATVTVGDIPIFTSEPVNATVCYDEGHNFEAQTTLRIYTQLSADEYQWMMWDGSSSWVNVPTGSVYSGQTTTQLRISSVDGLTGSRYRLNAKYQGCPSTWVESSEATLYVPAKPILNATIPSNTACIDQIGSEVFTAELSSVDEWNWQYSLDGNAWDNVTNDTRGSVTYTGYTTNTLTVSGVKQEMTGNTYYRIQTKYEHCPATWLPFGPATLLVPANPVFTLNPSNTTACLFSSATFTAKADPATDSEYQWHIWDGSDWDEITDLLKYQGTTTTQLIVLDLDATDASATFTLGAKNIGCPTSYIFATPAVLHVPEEAIFAYPSNGTVCMTQTHTFSMTVTNALPLTEYQWQRYNGTTWIDLTDGESTLGEYTGAVSSELTVMNARQDQENSEYRMKARVEGCPVTWTNSNPVTLEFWPQPDFTVTGGQPVSNTICEDYGFVSHTFTSRPSNADTYQWQLSSDGINWENVTDQTKYFGETTTGLFIFEVQGKDQLQYRMKARWFASSCPDIWWTSEAATLTVPKTPTYTSEHPLDATVCPDRGWFLYAHPKDANKLHWYIYNPNETNPKWVPIEESNLNYEGVTTTVLWIKSTNGLDQYGFQMRAWNVAGKVECPNGNQGVESPQAHLTVPAYPNFSETQPQSLTVCVNDGATFTSNPVDGNEYQWVWSNYESGPWMPIPAGDNQWVVSHRIAYSGATTTQLVIDKVRDYTGNNNYRYKLLARNFGCPVTWQWSDAATLYVWDQYPNFATGHQPNSLTICADNSTTYTMDAYATNGDEYKWSREIAGVWTDITDNTIFTGATTTELSICLYNVSNPADYEGQYRLSSRWLTCPKTWFDSESATLTLHQKPVFTQNPSNFTVCLDNNSATFTGLTDLTNDMEYQWYRWDATSWEAIVDASPNVLGSNTFTLVLSELNMSANGSVFALGARYNGCPSTYIMSSSATLTVFEDPQFGTAPDDATVCIGESHTFSYPILNTVSNEQYQWEASTDASTWLELTDGTTLYGTYAGVNTTNLEVLNIAAEMKDMYYRMKAKNNLCPTTWSNSETVQITFDEIPVFGMNDHPEDATVCNDGTGYGWTFTASPSYAEYYQWWYQVPGSAWAEVPNNPTAYAGVNTSALTIISVSGKNKYEFRLDVRNNTCPTNWISSNVATLTVPATPDFTMAGPDDATVCSDRGWTFTSAPANATTYQWFYTTMPDGNWVALTDGTAIEGKYFTGSTTTMLVIDNVAGFDERRFRLHAWNDGCTGINGPNGVPSNAAKLTVTTDPDFTGNHPLSATVCQGDGHTFTASAEYATEYRWEWFNSQAWVPLTEGLNPYHAITYTGTTTTSLQLSAVDFYGNNGALYRLAARRYGCPVSWVPSNPATLHIPYHHAYPQYATQPSSVTVCADNSASFTSTTQTTENIYYQWQIWENTTWVDISTGMQPYSGQTTTCLNISYAVGLSGNRYRMLSRLEGCPRSGIASEEAMLTTYDNPIDFTGYQPQDATVCEWTNYTLVSTPTNADQYRWQYMNGAVWTDLTNGTGTFAAQQYEGVSTTALSINNLLANAEYRLLALNNECPQTWRASSSASITLETKPSVTTQIQQWSMACTNESTSFTAEFANVNEYQWQNSTNNGSDWYDISSSSTFNYEGQSTNTLVIKNLTHSMTEYQYRLRARYNQCPTTWIATNAATLYVPYDPSFNTPGQQPASATVLCSADGSATFTAQAISVGTGLSYPTELNNTFQANAYQWVLDNSGTFTDLTDGTLYSGVTTSVLVVTNPTFTANNGNVYRLKARSYTCPNSWVISNAATLSVFNKPDFTNAGPMSATVCPDESHVFTSAPQFADLMQWQVNTGTSWEDITSATSTTYSIAPISLSMNGYQYRLRAWNNICPTSYYSNVVTMTVLSLPNSTFSTNPESVTVCSVYSTTFSSELSNADSYQWQKYNTTKSLYENIADNSVYAGTTTSELIVLQPTGLTGSTYRVLGRNGICPTSWIASTSAVMTVIEAPVISANEPSDRTICMNNALPQYFVVTLSGGNNYQWQWYDTYTETWVDMYNGQESGKWYGVTTNVLTIQSGLSTADNGRLFRMKARNNDCPESWTYSKIATLFVPDYPRFVAPGFQPQSATVCLSESHTFTGLATPATRYQWTIWMDWPTNQWKIIQDESAISSNYQGATTTALVVNNLTHIQLPYKPQYQLTAYNTAASCSDGGSKSNVALLTIVETEPDFSGANPLNVTVCEGSEAQFVSTPASADTYQWQVSNGNGWSNLVNNTIYTGVNSMTLSIANTTGLGGNEYRLSARAALCPSTWKYSTSATLNHIAGPDFTGHNPASAVVCYGTNVTHTLYSNPTNADSYRWEMYDGNDWITLSNDANYNGVTTTRLVITGIDSDVWNGNEYRLRAINNNCPINSYTSDVAVLTVPSVPTVSASPANTTVCPNAPATFVATFSNATAYQWQENTGLGWNNLVNSSIYNGVTTNTLTIIEAANSMNTYQYRVIAFNNGCPVDGVTSNSATLYVDITNTPSFTTGQHPATAWICTGSSHVFVSTPTNATTYQWQYFDGSNWQNIVNGGIYSGTNTNSLTISDVTGLNGRQFKLKAMNSLCPTVWVESNTAVLNVLNTPTVGAIGDATVCSGSSQIFTTSTTNATTLNWQRLVSGNWQNINDDAVYAGTTTNALTINSVNSTMNGYTYRLSASNIGCATVYSNQAVMTVLVAPTFTNFTTSGNIYVCTGNNYTLSSAVSNATQYQWQLSTDGGTVYNDIAGANTTTFVINNVTSGMNNYRYRLAARNSQCDWTYSTATYTAAILNVPTAPTVNPVASATACNGSTQTFAATATNATAYRWQVNTGSGWANIIDGTPYTGVTAQTLTINPVAEAMNGNRYRVIVWNNGCPVDGVTSSDGTLTVPTTPVFSLNPANATVINNTDHTFNAIASPVSEYKWQVSIDGGNNWSDINGAPYQGWTTANLTILNVTNTMNDYRYKALARNNGCPIDWQSSSSAILTIPSQGPATQIAFIPQPNPVGTQVSGQSFNVIIQAQDDEGNPAYPPANWTINLTKDAGLGSITAGGNGTILSTQTQTTINLTYTYTPGETGVRLQANSGTMTTLSNYFAVVGPAPTLQSSNFRFVGSPGLSYLTFQWTRGNGDGCLVIGKLGNETQITEEPINGTSYTPSLILGSGDPVPATGATAYAVYDGTGRLITVSGLTRDTRYAFKIFEYKNTDGGKSYLLSTGTNYGSRKTAGKISETEGPIAGETVNTTDNMTMSHVMPNPAKDKISFWLFLQEGNNVNVSIYSLDGKQMLSPVQDRFYNGNQQHLIEIPFERLSAGSYRVVVNAGNEIIVEHFVVLP